MSEQDSDEGAEIIIGTYEDYVIGYNVESLVSKKDVKVSNGTRKQSNKLYSLEQSFAVRSHSGSVKCVATNEDGSLAFSVGFDEMMNLFSLKRRKLLQTSEGAYNCALFVGKTHLICGSDLEDDGNIYIYECKSNSEMTLVKTLKGHKSSIVSMDVHPSGKVLISLSKDNIMRTWNLIKGRSAYVTNIRSSSKSLKAHLIKWSRTGNEFMIAANNEVYLYSNSTGNLEHNLKFNKRINSIEFITDNIFIVATDSGQLEYFNLSEFTINGGGEGDVDLKCELVLKHEAHDARVKCVKFLQEDDKNVRFVTASSDGVVKLWSLSKLQIVIEEPIELASINTGARLTCMTTAVRRDG